MMKWSHLPNAGGIYDQSPKLMDEFLVLWNVKSKIDMARHKKEQAEQKRASRAGRRR